MCPGIPSVWEVRAAHACCRIWHADEAQTVGEWPRKPVVGRAQYSTNDRYQRPDLGKHPSLRSSSALHLTASVQAHNRPHRLHVQICWMRNVAQGGCQTWYASATTPPLVTLYRERIMSTTTDHMPDPSDKKDRQQEGTENDKMKIKQTL